MVIRCIRAVAGNHMETVQVLLEFGADKGARNVRRAVHGTRSRSRAPLTRPVLTTQRYHKLPTALNQSTHMARLLQEHRACQALISSGEPSLTSIIARRLVLAGWQWRIGLPTPPRFTAMILTLLLIRRFVEDSMLAAIPNELLFVLLEFMPLTPYFERDRSS